MAFLYSFVYNGCSYCPYIINLSIIPTASRLMIMIVERHETDSHRRDSEVRIFLYLYGFASSIWAFSFHQKFILKRLSIRIFFFSLI